MDIPEEQQEWRQYGKCASLTTAEADKLFFFGPGGSPVRANKFCSTCPVKRNCLHFAILHNEDGVWAGTTQDERHHMQDLLPIDRILNQGLVILEVRLSPDSFRRSSEVQKSVELLESQLIQDQQLALQEIHAIELDLSIFQLGLPLQAELPKEPGFPIVHVKAS